MAKGIFNKKLSPACKYCENAVISSFDEDIICRKKGVTRPDDRCGKYKYDPFKRVPNKIIINKNYSKDDFEI